MFTDVLAAKLNNLTSLTPCTCPGYEIIYRCDVLGAGITIWQGTLFDLCQDGSITLRHTQFRNGRGTTRLCGSSGVVNGRGIGVEGDVYTSQLTINVSSEMQGKTVACVHNNGSSMTTVGSSQILLTTGKAMIFVVLIFLLCDFVIQT